MVQAFEWKYVFKAMPRLLHFIPITLLIWAAIILSALIFVIRNRHMEELFPSTYQASVKYVLKDAAGGYGYDLSLIVPEDMSIGVTAFELMAGDQVIGEKTPSAEVLRDIEFPERSSSDM